MNLMPNEMPKCRAVACDSRSRSAAFQRFIPRGGSHSRHLGRRRCVQRPGEAERRRKQQHDAYNKRAFRNRRNTDEKIEKNQGRKRRKEDRKRRGGRQLTLDYTNRQLSLQGPYMKISLLRGGQTCTLHCSVHCSDYSIVEALRGVKPFGRKGGVELYSPV